MEVRRPLRARRRSERLERVGCVMTVINDESDAFPAIEFLARNDQAHARRLHLAIKG